MAIQFLIKSYPKFVYVKDLPLDSDFNKVRNISINKNCNALNQF